MAEQVFKNIQALKGIPVDDFMETMGIMTASLQFDCSDCHDECRHRQGKLGSRHSAERERRA